MCSHVSHPPILSIKWSFLMSSHHCLKEYSTDFTHQVQFAHHIEYYSACENSFIMCPVDLLKVKEKP